MARKSLTETERICIRLNAIASRNAYTTEPAAVVAELRAYAGGRDDLLARAAGEWAGYHQGRPETAQLAEALRRVAGTAGWVEEGRRRARQWRHDTSGFASQVSRRLH